MRLYILFGHRPEEYEGQYAPEVLVCWDEFCVESNPDGFDEECAKSREKYGDEFAAMRVFEVEVDGEEIVKHLTHHPVIQGEIKHGG